MDNGQIDLAWNPVNGATAYNIYWSEDGETYYYIDKVTAMPETKYSDIFWSAIETTYYYKVTAVKSESEFSQVATFAMLPNGTAPALLLKTPLNSLTKTQEGRVSLRKSLYERATNVRVVRAGSLKINDPRISSLFG